MTGGGGGDTGGTNPCIYAADPIDSNTVDILSEHDDGTPCSEEFTVVVF